MNEKTQSEIDAEFAERRLVSAAASSIRHVVLSGDADAFIWASVARIVSRSAIASGAKNE